ncbi:MAG TPA: pilus assembly protein N-terminal domain-containing protein [Xanthobacteraceae bacterium]|nr:pilus assembly protein N-terminal domain-containing protein [Xanthobacteraceae bacterium]
MLRQSLKTLILLCALALYPHTARAEAVSVVLDQARLLRIPTGVATIIIGNPSIADGTLQSGGLLVVTGKGYGTTNLMALDSKGEVIIEHQITVSAPNSGVVVYRGPDRETLNCNPSCQRTIAPGDAQAVFNAAVQQSGQRNTLATGAAAQAQRPPAPAR